MQKYHGEEFNTLALHSTTKKMRKFSLNKFVVVCFLNTTQNYEIKTINKYKISNHPYLLLCLDTTKSYLLLNYHFRSGT